MRYSTLRIRSPFTLSSAGLAAAIAAAAFLFAAGDALAQGWNPADMLRRADRNGDGKLEAGEVDERFKGFLERAAGEAGIRSGFPYDVNQLTEAMDRRRRERDDDDDDDRRDRDRDQSSTSKPEPLVPGFGGGPEIPAPLGFGGASVFLTREQAQAQYGSRLVGMVDAMLERYDRDKSGALEQREWEGARWSSPPESSDANKDGILTQSELYMRLKDRYSGNDDDDDDDDRDRDENRAGSSRLTQNATPTTGVLSNIPGIGTGGSTDSRQVSSHSGRDDDDEDGDGRSRRSNDAAPAAPGVIVGGGPNGPAPNRFSGPGGPGGPSGSRSWNRDEDEENEDEEEYEDEEEEEAESGPDPNQERYNRFADMLTRQYDKNKNGTLERDEWSKMTGDPGAADYDKNGILTKEEMARRLAEKSGDAVSASSTRSSSPSRTSSLQTNRTGVSSKDAYAASRTYAENGETPTYRFLTPVERLPSGVPDWFLEKDKNADAQVGMYEYADDWSDDTAEKFMALDKNRDGFLSAAEAQAGEGGGEEASR